MSMGSENRDVVPQRRDFFASSDGKIYLSTCVCESANPGVTYRFSKSITTVFSPTVCDASVPTYAILSLKIAISVPGIISTEFNDEIIVASELDLTNKSQFLILL